MSHVILTEHRPAFPQANSGSSATGSSTDDDNNLLSAETERARSHVVKRSPVAKTSAKTFVPPDTKKITVLLAEERAIIRQGIKALLCDTTDLEVVGQASDCSKVLELAGRLRPDVVIVSISLALRNGLADLGRTLKSCCSACVLVLMPHNNSSFSQQVLAEGAAGYLSEQACPQILTATVRDAHAQRQAPPSPNSIGKWRTPSPEKFPFDGESPLYLTSREREVLHLIAGGYPNKQTASLLSISIKTVEKHRQNLMDKLGIHETAGLTRYALYTGII